jgi:hypothetical protein
MGYTAKGFVKGDARIEFDANSFVTSSTIDLVFGYLLRSGLHDQFVTVVPLQITPRCQSCHKLLTTQRHRLLTNLEKKSISNTKEDIGKFLSNNKDILDKPFLVYWICVDDSHWISIIGINLSQSDKKRVCGFIVLDSLQDEQGRNKLPLNSGFCFLLNNLCHKNVDDDSIEPYGQFDCVNGEENFRQIYFMNESLLPQKG